MKNDESKKQQQQQQKQQQKHEYFSYSDRAHKNTDESHKYV